MSVDDRHCKSHHRDKDNISDLSHPEQSTYANVQGRRILKREKNVLRQRNLNVLISHCNERYQEVSSENLLKQKRNCDLVNEKMLVEGQEDFHQGQSSRSRCQKLKKKNVTSKKTKKNIVCPQTKFQYSMAETCDEIKDELATASLIDSSHCNDDSHPTKISFFDDKREPIEVNRTSSNCQSQNDETPFVKEEQMSIDEMFRCVRKKIHNERVCTICLERNPNMTLLCCGSAYHFTCLNKWLTKCSSSESVEHGFSSRTRTCPMCRDSIEIADQEWGSTSDEIDDSQFMQDQIDQLSSRVSSLMNNNRELTSDLSTFVARNSCDDTDDDLDELLLAADGLDDGHPRHFWAGGDEEAVREMYEGSESLLNNDSEDDVNELDVRDSGTSDDEEVQIVVSLHDGSILAVGAADSDHMTHIGI